MNPLPPTSRVQFLFDSYAPTLRKIVRGLEQSSYENPD
jgi:hypothetical protein